MNGGTLNGGTLNGGTLNGGTLNGGTLNGGTLNGGTLNGGTLNGGTLNGVKPDRAEVVRAMRAVLLPGQVTELRALDATTRGDRFAQVYSGYFDDVEKLASAALQIASAKGVYFVPNPIHTGLLSRAANRVRPAKKDPTTSDGDVTSRWWLLVDADAKRPAGISASDAEHDAALAKAGEIRDALRAGGWPDPLLADSGNGAHLLYRIDEPAKDGGLVERCLKTLAARFDDHVVSIDQTVFNPARIWKLYGTVAGKGDSTPDRPHRLSHIIDTPAPLEVVPHALLEAMAAPAATPPAAARPRPAPADGRSFDLDGWMARHAPEAKGPRDWNGNSGRGRRWVFGVCPWNSAHTNESAYVLQFPLGAIEAGCRHDGCKGNDWHALRDRLEPGWRDRRSQGRSAQGRAAAPAALPPPPAGNGHGSNGHAGRFDQPNPAGPYTVPGEPRRRPPVPYRRPEPFKPFPLHTLPNPWARFIAEGAAALGCDPAFVALPTLPMFGSAVGMSRRIRLKRKWAEPPIVWTAVVAPSGSLKSPAHELAMGPAYRRQRRANSDFRQAKRAFDEQSEDFKEQLKCWKKRPAAERGDRPAEPEPPVHQRLICQDVTTEALADRLEFCPRGLLNERDELAGLIGSFDQYKGGKGGDIAHWLSMFGGRLLIIDRKTSGRPNITIPFAAVSIAGGIQPRVLKAKLTPGFFDNGFAARLLAAMPSRAPKVWTDADLDPQTEGAVEQIYDALLDLVPATGMDGQPEPADVPLSSDALDTFIDFYNAHNEKHFNTGDDRDDALSSKIEGYAPRFALIVHQVRHAIGDVDDPFRVDRRSMESGIALAEWFGRETRRVYDYFVTSEEETHRQWLIDLVRGTAARGDDMTVNKLRHLSRRYKSPGEAREALDSLADAGLGRWEILGPKANGGRPTERFLLTLPADDPEQGAVSSTCAETSPTLDSERITGVSEAKATGDRVSKKKEKEGEGSEQDPYADAPENGQEDAYDREERLALEDPNFN